MTTDRDRAQAALDAMNRAEKLLHAALAATDEGERLRLGFKFMAAAAEVDVEALGGVTDYPQPVEALELLRELREWKS